MLTAIRDIGSLFRSEADDPILSRLDELDLLGRPLTVILDLFTSSSSFQITFEETASDSNARYLFRKGPSSGVNFSPATNLDAPEKALPNRILRWFRKFSEEKNSPLSPEDLTFLRSLYSLLTSHEAAILAAIQRCCNELEPDLKRRRREAKKPNAGFFLGLRIDDKYLREWPVFRTLFLSQLSS